ncbi:hypothetical protein [Microvirga brassicacearum]|uniref:Uncharacterized protein n=1 Tax=Microvirga brassicacearum TaxID=2580413 RepID=A0A5N3PF08_9HYPH|nr:hypothetical protein [Microvirga brassicacearum]KAB0268332.1 hypothetical protein FEZ63_04860 [Microvirga brassicacearum]
MIGRNSSTLRLTLIAGLSAFLVAGEVRAETQVGVQPGQQSAPDRERPPISPEEIRSLLPLLVPMPEQKQLAGELRAFLRSGDVRSAANKLTVAIEVGTLASILLDWVSHPALMAALQSLPDDLGDAASALSQPAAVNAVETTALEEALETERERAAALANELHTVNRDFQALKTSREQDAASMSAATTELQASLKRQEERAEAAARELAAVSKELATLRAARQRESMSAASEIANLQQALVRERERGDDVAREWAARVDEMRALQETTERQEVKANRWVFSLEGIAMAGPADDSAGRQSVVTTGAIAAPVDGEAATSAAASDKNAIARATPPLPSDDRLIARAEALFRSGDVSGARLLLERAQEDGNAQATFLLAETFDPNALSTIGAVGIRSDPERARELYRHALALGVVRATARVEALK